LASRFKGEHPRSCPAITGLDGLASPCNARSVVSEILTITSRIRIPLREIRIDFVRSGGPGGQNVNKVATKAVLRFNLRDSPSFPEATRQRAMTRLASSLTNDGDLILTSSKYRDQSRNRAEALRRLAEMLSDASRPRKQRTPTRPTRAAKERRLAEKKAHGRRKQERTGGRAVDGED